MPIGTQIFDGVTMTTDSAADPGALRLLSAGIIEHLFDDLADAFARQTGHRVTARFNPTGNIVRWVEAGEPGDVVVLATRASMQALIDRGEVAAGSAVVFAKAVIGVAVRDGAPAIDISSADALKAAMLGARAFAHADPAGGSSSGAHVARLIDSFGIGDRVAGKIVSRSRGQLTIRAVAEGVADFVVAQCTEIAAVPGVRYIGPLPDGIQAHNHVVAAIRSGSPRAAEAAEFLKFLASPLLRPHWHKLGFADP